MAKKSSDNDVAGPSPSDNKKSVMILAIVSLLSIIVGVLGGYFFATQQFSAQCDTILKAARSENEEKHRKIMETLDKTKDELNVLKGKAGECSSEGRMCADVIENSQLLTSKLEALEGVNKRYESALLDIQQCHVNLDKSLAEKESMEMSIQEMEKEMFLLEELKEDSEQLQKCQYELDSLEDAYLYADEHLAEVLQQKRQLETDKENEIALCKKKQQGWEKRVDYMEEYVAKLSRRAVIERYGEGPHHVILDIRYQVDPQTKTGPRSSQIIIELAPLDLMPHAVHSFLDMVSRGLYNGCLFAFGSRFLVAIAPETRDANRQRELFVPFEEQGFNPPLAYQEYNPDYPHEIYSVSFSGGTSISGPAFFIALTDEISELHLKSGKALDDHGLPLRREPCFGKVVIGHEDLEFLQNIERDPPDGLGWIFPEVIVEKATIQRK